MLSMRRRTVFQTVRLLMESICQPVQLFDSVLCRTFGIIPHSPSFLYSLLCLSVSTDLSENRYADSCILLFYTITEVFTISPENLYSLLRPVSCSSQPCYFRSTTFFLKRIYTPQITNIPTPLHTKLMPYPSQDAANAHKTPHKMLAISCTQ